MGDREAGSKDLGFQRFGVLVADQLVIDGGNRILPDQLFLRHEGAKVAGDRTHVAMRELEPGAGKVVGQLLRILQEVARDLFVNRIDAQGDVGGQHDRLMTLLWIVRIGNGVFTGVALGLPLVGAGGTLG